ncbi:MAG: chemotaxis protein CheV [Chromatiaceae bacterium]|nr:chemotaxis protein CheV [Chromatiaceae bacterium]
MAGILDGIDQRTNLAGQNRLELLLFRLHSRQRFGINVFKVQEVIRCPQLTQLPGAHPAVCGIANLRGKTISIIDLSMAIGNPPLGDNKERYIILAEYNRRVQGFLVGSVDRIINMTWGEIMPPPKGTGKNSYMTAVTQVDKELVEIIDVEKVLKELVGGSEMVSAGVIDEALRSEASRVLVVDDSSVARNQVKRVLDQLGVETMLCNDGGEALQQLKHWLDEGKDVEKYLSLVISDVEMPRMDGYTLTSEIRKHPKLANLYVILHTSLSGVFNESMIKRVGADKFLAKYEPDELAEMVQQQIKEHRAVQAAVA